MENAGQRWCARRPHLLCPERLASHPPARGGLVGGHPQTPGRPAALIRDRPSRRPVIYQPWCARRPHLLCPERLASHPPPPRGLGGGHPPTPGPPALVGSGRPLCRVGVRRPLA